MPFKSRSLAFLHILILTLAAAGIFARVGGYEFLNFDDNVYVQKNPHINGGLSAQSASWAFRAGLFERSVNSTDWWPLSAISHAAAFSLFGDNPAGHHLINGAIHLLNVCLVYALLAALAGSGWHAFWVAALFALHPVQAEPVAWITARKDLLSACFALLTMNVFVRCRERLTVGRTALLAALFTASLLSKTSALLLPALLMLLGAGLWPQSSGTGGDKKTARPGWAHLAIKLSPLFALSALFALITIKVQSYAVSADQPAASRIFGAAAAVAHYLRSFFYPMDLAIYAETPDRGPAVLLAACSAALCALITIAVFAWRDRAPQILLGWLWFMALLLPVLVLPYPADRYLYLPMIGIAMMLVWGLPSLPGLRTIPLRAWGAVAALTIVALGAVTFGQIGHWKNSRTLFERALERHPDNYLALNNLGTYFKERGDREKAREFFAKAVEVNPKYALPLIGLANDAYDAGRLAEAREWIDRALAAAPGNPSVHNALGNILAKEGRPKEAALSFKKALELRPDYPEAYHNLGLLYTQTGELALGKSYLEKASAIQPQSYSSQMNLALIHERSGQMDAAASAYQAAIRIKPDGVDAYNGLGRLWLGMGRLQEAERMLLEAVRIEPGYTRALVNLGVLYTQSGRRAEAMECYQKALKIEPRNTPALNGAGILNGYLGNYAEAKKYFLQVLAINPDFPGTRENLRQIEAFSTLE